MNYQKRNRFISAEDSFAVFLYSKLIIDNSQINSFEQEYQDFLLTDTIVHNYNNWIDNDCHNRNIINTWIKNNFNIKENFKKEFGEIFQPKAVIWGDRKKNDYFIDMLQRGHEYECFLENLFKTKYSLDLGIFEDQNGQYEKGECELGIEIKFDMKLQDSGNIYIEYGEKSSKEKTTFVDSGILKNDDSIYFLIGDRENFFIFTKDILIDLYEKKSQDIFFIQIDTSRGFLISSENAKKYTISTDELVDRLKNTN